MNGNTVRLIASLAAMEALRHTPAGIPVIEFTLSHASQQMEAGSMRQVEFDMPAKAAGEMAARIARLSPGCKVEAQGFLNRRHRMSRQLVLHVTNIELI
ncbi:MAG: primosomal replication protein N [Burkholderiales bacterium]|nr:primosomal replication protein N [Burkholderiales bacterium]